MNIHNMLSHFKGLGKWVNATTQRRLIIWSIGFWVVSLSILNLTFLWVGQGRMLSDTRQRNMQMASIISRDVNSQGNDILGGSRVFVQHLEMLGPSLNGQANAVLGLRLSSPEYRTVYYYDKSGFLLFALTDSLQNLSNVTKLDELIARPAAAVKDQISAAFDSLGASSIFISDVYYTQPDYNPAVDVSMPVTFSSGESRVIVFEVDLSSIWQKIDLATIGQTGITYAVSRKGIIIAHPDPSYLGRQIPAEIRPVLSNFEGFVEFTDPYQKADVIATYSPVGGPTGWGIVVEQEKAEAYAAINSTGLAIIILWLALGLVGTVSIFILTRSFTRPIQELTRTARKIALTGEMTPTGLERRSDEIGQLSQAFDQMSERINQAQKDKEEAALAERTRLARELHDAVSQTLFSASLIAEVLPRLWERNPDEGRRRLEEIRQLTRGALAEMRTLLFELRPAALEDVSLKDLLKQLSQQLRAGPEFPFL
jgi:HAMP domain-containing protein